MTDRHRPETTRTGTTSKVCVGPVTLYITVNGQPPIEVFAKCDEGHQADADGLAELASLALQYGCPASVVAEHLRHRRYPPHGGPGQPCSISDAIGREILKVEDMDLAISLERVIQDVRREAK